MRKYYLTFLYSALLIFSTSIIQLNSQTLSIAQVYNYKVGDIICTQIDNGDDLPNYQIDTIVYVNTAGNSLTIIKHSLLYVFNFKKGVWESELSRDSAVYNGISNAYFNKFLIKDSTHTDLDTNGNIVNQFEIKDSVFTGVCGKQANYSRYYSKKGSNSVLQIVTAYEGLGVYFTYEQQQNNQLIILREKPQFSISNGQFCGDSSVLRSFKNVSVSNLTVSSFQIWPNPFLDVIHVDMDLPFQYSLFDHSGKLLYRGTSDSQIIEINNLCSGIYHLRITIENQSYDFKVIKL